MKISVTLFTALSALVLLTAAPSISEANMARAIPFELPPSSVIFSPTQDLTVLHEKLHFDCSSEGCEVSATYHIKSKQQAVLKMSFISPSDRVGTIIVNGLGTKSRVVPVVTYAGRVDKESTQEFISVFGKLTKTDQCDSAKGCNVAPDLSLPEGWKHYIDCLCNNTDLSGEVYDSRQLWALYQFNFNATVHSGENVVQVNYHQPYSFFRWATPYFTRQAEPERYVSYELWPLKEWSLDPAFRIDLSVRLHNPRHGFLYRKRDGLSVRGVQFKAKPPEYSDLLQMFSQVVPDSTNEQQDDYLQYRVQMDGNFSDRLYIKILPN